MSLIFLASKPSKHRAGLGGALGAAFCALLLVSCTKDPPAAGPGPDAAPSADAAKGAPPAPGAAEPAGAGAAAAAGAAPAPAAAPAAAEALEPATCGSIRQLHELGGVFLAGQPSEEDLKVAHAQGVKTIITLRKPGEISWDEGAAARALGLSYHEVPFQAPEELTDSTIEELRGLLKDASKRPLMLHCGSANRVGAVWLAHRVLDDGVEYDAALAEARTVGLRSDPLLVRIREYIESQKK